MTEPTLITLHEEKLATQQQAIVYGNFAVADRVKWRDFLSPSGSTRNYVDIDITQLVRDWVDGVVPNEGVVCIAAPVHP